MATRRRQQFVYGQTVWMVTAALAYTLIGSLSYTLFFTTSLVGFLVLVELTAPFNVTPRWQARLKWIVLLGVLVFGYIVVRRIVRLAQVVL